MMIVYIAGPYTHGDVAENVTRAMEAAHQVLDAGHTPFCPHLSHFLHLHRQRPYEDWIRMDNEFVHVSDALIRLPGYSKGADDEVELALGLRIPVYGSVEEWLASL